MTTRNPRIDLTPEGSEDSRHSYSIEYDRDAEPPMLVWYVDAETGVNKLIDEVDTREQAYLEAEAHYEGELQRSKI